MQWTNFDPYTLPKAAREIHVTLDSRGQFYLNGGAMLKLGDPVAVRLMFDKDEGLIGIAAAPLKAKAAIELRSKYGEESPGRVFRATYLCRHLGILPERTLQFRDPKIEDGVLILNIRTTTYAPRRAEPLKPRS